MNLKIHLAMGMWVAAASLVAQPGIRQNGVVNSASQIPPTLAGGAIARGALFTIYGVRLGALGKTSARLGGNDLRLTAVRDDQIDAQMPDSAPLGSSMLVVTSAGIASKPFPIVIVPSNPGLFSKNGEGWGPGRIENQDSHGRRSPNSTVNPARPGQRVILLSTGLGSIRQITAVIGNRPVQTERVRPTNRTGEDELWVHIPTNAPAGCYVPVYLLATPGRASNVVTIAISAGGRPCDPGPIPLLNSDRIALAVFSRTRMQVPGDAESIFDEAIVAFAAKDRQPAIWPLLLLPPPGSCTAYTSSFQATNVLPTTVSAALIAELGGKGLEAGAKLTLDAPSRVIPRIPGAPGYYRTKLGTSGPRAGRRARPPVLDPRQLVLTGTGGADVGPFTLTIPGPAPFEWTDREQHDVIPRDQSLSVHWRGAATDRMILILATNVDQITTAIGECLCTERASAGTFRIPAALLANVPASMDIPGVPYDQLFVASLPARPAPAIRATGIAQSALVTMYAVGRFVEYK